MPTLAVAKSSWPRILSGGARSARVRAATRQGRLPSSPSPPHPPNSSPPLPAAGDVGPGAGHAVRFPPLVAHGEAAAQHPAVAAVPVSDPTLHLEVRFPALEVGVQARAKRAAPLRGDAAQPLLGGRADVGL